MVPSARLRILLDYRPALRQRTGVGESAHQMASALARRAYEADVTLFSSSWKDRLDATVVPRAATVDARIPVRVLNLFWHRLGWPPVELFGVRADAEGAPEALADAGADLRDRIGAVYSVGLFAVTFVVTALQFSILERRVHYAN